MGLSCIRHVSIFKDITDEEVAYLRPFISSFHINKGKIIFIEGENADTLYFLESGLVKMLKSTEDGREQIIRILFPGDVFGQAVLQKNGHYYANAEALQDSNICVIKKNDFEKALNSYPTLSSKLVLSLYERLRNAEEWLFSLSLLEVEQRLARIILTFYDKFKTVEGSIILPIAKKDLASLIGTTRETLSRKLTVFVQKNLIQMSDNEIHIINYEKLKQIAIM